MWSVLVSIGHFSAREDAIIKIRQFFEEKRALEVVEVIEAAEVLRPGKSPLRTLESSRHLNSALFLCFEKKKIGVES